ncbi:cation efflux family protein [Niveomyces insectorum RCEF 264]|uniref:Cation efflux family protein n=1 Tax=Niveomyces insectorum RCEF 264 TaxID=1081102 RepID=A0A162MRV2_9HYPO|nr:cation efflux family protein [Niveomyces insectorum RCEF 264]
MAFRLTPKRRLMATIGISFAFFVAEIAVAIMTKSLALIADAFHYMNDLVGFIVALTALIISERSDSPQELSFGWQRARLLGAFFNGVFLLALGISIFLQSLERFISLQNVENPKLVLIMGCVGLALNVVSAAFLHEHAHDHGDGHAHGADEAQTAADTDHELNPLHPHADHRHATVKSGPAAPPGRDLNMLGAFVHVVGDAANNVGVIVAALVIWKTSYPARFYADPGVSMGIAFMILLSALPLVKLSGSILLQSAPHGVDLQDVKHDLEKIPGIESVHELHIWRLDQKKAIASAHVVVSDQAVSSFMDKARTVSECLHAYGIHSATLQPELSYASQVSLASPSTAPSASASASVSVSASTPVPDEADIATDSIAPRAQQNDTSDIPRTAHNAVSVLRRRRIEVGGCQIPCGTLCENLMCCK